MQINRIFVFVALAALSATAKDRAWQTGTVLDTDRNAYFANATYKAGSDPDNAPSIPGADGNYAVSMNSNNAGLNLFRQNYVIESPDSAYLVFLTQLKSFKAPRLSLVKPVRFAVEKNKLWFVDLDGQQYETKILKQAAKQGTVIAKQQPEQRPAPVQPVVRRQEPKEATSISSRPAPKKEPVKVATLEPPKKPTVRPVVKPEPKREIAIAKPPVERAVAPTEAAARASEKDRAWQAGQLLSLMSNRYFANIGYSSEIDGSAWTLVQGSDGRYSVGARASAPASATFVYDNYVIESQFCVYLVQHARPRSEQPVRFPGTRPLKFAVEKSKLWVIGEDGKEYETKVVKLLQKDSGRESGIQTAAR